jgi:hypothetical protein
LRRGSSIQDFADKIDTTAGQLITVLFALVRWQPQPLR